MEAIPAPFLFALGFVSLWARSAGRGMAILQGMHQDMVKQIIDQVTSGR